MNIDVINLAQYEAPQIIESKQKGWVTFGENNSYFQFLIDRYRKSATNQSIINNVTRLMYGKGLGVIDASRKPSEYAQVMALFNKDCLRKLCFDLKTLGQCAIQVHYNDKHDKILKAFHIDMNLLAPEKCDDEGKINNWYYSNNWEDIKKFPPKKFATFGSSKDKVEILVVKPYAIGMKYFSLPDYIAGTAYALLEEEVADYLIGETQTRFSGTTVVNLNNGQPDIETQNLLQQQIKNKLTGSKGQRVIVGFNNNKETATTVESIALNDAPDLYSQMSLECERKIMVSHSITSGLLLGLGSANGFGSNADELKNAFVLFDNMVIRPLQQLLISGLEQITSFNGNTAKLYFDRLQPLDASGDLTVDTENKKLIETINSLSPLVANKVIETLTPNEIRAIVGLKPEKGGSDLTNIETGTELSKVNTELEEILARVDSEQLGDGWVMVDEREIEEDDSDLDLELIEAEKKLEPKTTILSALINLIQTGNARPDLKSSQDKKVGDLKYFKVRYKYTGNKNPERAFCKAMMAREERLFRKEDIEEMSRRSVNPGFGEFGGNVYDIFKFKGGARCHHKFARVTFMLDLNAIEDGYKKVGTREAEVKGYKVTNPYQVSFYPNNLPLKGFSPRNKNLPKDVQ
jgi:hypothetical protein